jgi:TRAP-type C4-dicarboxylate transport system permease small subunit
LNEGEGSHLKQTAKKAIFLVRDILELYIPVVAFVGLFSVFVLQVFFRYILRNPQSWATEVTAACFLWTVLLGACYAQRKKSHVMFTLVYDMLSVKWKAFTAFLGNLIIAAAFAISVKPTWDFILFMKVQKTSILKIGMHLIYLPYIVFLILMLIYTIADLYADFMTFTGLGGKKFEEKLIEESIPDYQKAIDDAIKGEEGIE